MANRKQGRKAAAAESIRADKEKATASVTGTDKKPSDKPAQKPSAAKKAAPKRYRTTPAEKIAKAPMAKRAARVTKKSSEGKPQVRTPGRTSKSLRVTKAAKEGDATRAATKKAETKLIPGIKAGAPTWARTVAGREMQKNQTRRDNVGATAEASLNDPAALRVDPDAKPIKRVRPGGTSSRRVKPPFKPTQADVKKARSKNQKYRFRGN